MNAIAMIQRRHRHRPAPSVSLFAFLAVLICTMGALMLLLLAVTRQARQQALREAAAKAEQQQGDVKVQREMIQWRIEQLKTSRQTTEGQLAAARLYLGHLEDHARRLRDRLKQLQAAGGDLARAGNDGNRHRAGLGEELGTVQRQIADAQHHLVEAKQQAQRRPHSYAIIPYAGPGETHRRPIYLECRGHSVVLQPEGIEFTESDFDGPMGPGNPLAAALRATREYMLAQGRFDAQHGGEPYPLLLVRPEGIKFYYAARGAMKSWGPEFGYELVGDDWKFQFPQPDAQLARIVQQEIVGARASQARLIAAAPSRYGEPQAEYHVASAGNVVCEGGSGTDDGDGGGFHAAHPSGPVGNRYGDSSTASAAGPGGNALASWPGGGGPSGLPGAGVPGGSASGPGATGYASGSPGATGYASAYPGAVVSSGTGTSIGPMPGNAVTPGAAGNATGSPGNTATSGTGTAAAGQPANANGQGPAAARATRPDGYVVGQPVAEQDRPTRPTSSDDQAGSAPRPGEWQPHEMYDTRPDDNDKKDDPKSLAKKRGRDWGLRDANHKSTPISRPIRVECYADRLVLVPDTGWSGRKEIPLGPRTEGSIDKFIAAVWDDMDSWGMAGNSMYWHPVLNCYVAPGGQQRFNDLHILLEGSGLPVERKQ